MNGGAIDMRLGRTEQKELVFMSLHAILTQNLKNVENWGGCHMLSLQLTMQSTSAKI